MLLRRWRLFIEGTKVILFSLKIFIAIIAKFAIWTRLVRASMPGIGVSRDLSQIGGVVCKCNLLCEII